jgi:hypothetical protein
MVVENFQDEEQICDLNGSSCGWCSCYTKSKSQMKAPGIISENSEGRNHIHHAVPCLIF